MSGGDSRSGRTSRASLAVTAVTAPIAASGSFCVCFPARSSRAFTLLCAPSIGEKSGEYAGMLPRGCPINAQP